MSIRRPAVRLITAVGAMVGLVASSGCSEDPEAIATSDVISIKMGGIKEGDVKDGQASVDKGITTESGNPYGEFMKTARARLDGGDPSAILVTRVDVRVHTDTDGINSLEEVFDSLEVFLANSNTTIPIGSHDAPSGTSLSVPVVADGDDLEPLYDSLMAADFDVGVRGPSSNDGSTKFDLRLTVDIGFEALP